MLLSLLSFVILQPLVKYGVRPPKFIWAFVYSCTHWMRLLPCPPIWAYIRGRYFVSQVPPAFNHSRETLPVDVLEEDKPGRLADVLKDEVRGEGEDDVGQIGTRHEVTGHAVPQQQRRHLLLRLNGKINFKNP
jgi:hypothetical protein